MTGGSRRQQRPGKGRERRISVRAVRRNPPDLNKLSRALIALAEAEAKAQADHEAASKKAGERD